MLFRSHLIRVGGTFVLLFVVQFIAADNWGFQFIFSDTASWRSFSCVPLPDVPFRALHGPLGRVLLQPSLFIIDTSWHDIAYHGTSVRTPMAATLIDLCTNHRLLFLNLIAAVNACVWTVLGFLILSGARFFRRVRARSSRPA